MTKSIVAAIVNKIAENANALENGYHYEVKINDWANYGKDRTYFSIVETRDNSRHNKEFKYGYFDNISGECYIDENAFKGTYMEFNENIITDETKKVAAIDKPVEKLAYCDPKSYHMRVLGYINVKYWGATAYVSKSDCDKIRQDKNNLGQFPEGGNYIVWNLPSLYDDCYDIVEIDGDIY